MDIDKMTYGELRQIARLFSCAGAGYTNPHIGNKVIIRSYDAGVHFGTLINQQSMGGRVEVELANTRRVWSWTGAAELNQVAMEGVRGGNISMQVPTKTIFNVIEIIPMSNAAIANMEAQPIWKK